jgi:hypothetical protein
MDEFEKDYQEVRNDTKRSGEIIFAALFCVASYAGGLRGEEVPLMEVYGTKQHYLDAINHPSHPHVVMALRGRFKNEYGELHHLMPLCLKTKSGLDVKVWFERMLSWYERRGISSGPVFRDNKGDKAKARMYEYEILSRLERVQHSNPDIIPLTVNVHDEFGVSRSFRRGSNTQAREQGVSEAEVNLNNRWCQVEHSRGRRPKRNMQEHYTDVRLLLNKLLRYSRLL